MTIVLVLVNELIAIIKIIHKISRIVDNKHLEVVITTQCTCRGKS